MSPSEAIKQIVENPTEKIDVEVKNWIDPNSDEGKEKIIKGCIALYNANGGYFVIGFNDDGTPHEGEEKPSDVRSTYDQDKLQSFIVKFSTVPFQLLLEFPEVGGQEYPVIEVPSGVTTPAITKKSFGKIIADELYIRTVAAGQVGSSKPKREDWDRIIRIWLDNREADIANFFRRQLGLTVNVDALKESFSLPPTLEKQVLDYLEFGKNRFVLENEGKQVPDVGFLEIVAVVDQEPPEVKLPDDTFLTDLKLRVRNYSEWPPFIVRDIPFERNVRENAWEANIHTNYYGRTMIDFWRIDPKGKFYSHRSIPDDMNETSGVEPLKYLDPILHIGRVAEAIATVLNLVEAMDYELSGTNVAVAFRWSHLRGRIIHSWSDKNRGLGRDIFRCDENTKTVVVSLPGDLPQSRIWEFVNKIASDLMVSFSGYDRIEVEAIKEIVERTLSRRMRLH